MFAHSVDALFRSERKFARLLELDLALARPPVCTENSNPDVMMVKPAEDRV